MIVLQDMLNTINNRLGCFLVLSKDFLTVIQSNYHICRPFGILQPERRKICCAHHCIGIMHTQSDSA